MSKHLHNKAKITQDLLELRQAIEKKSITDIQAILTKLNLHYPTFQWNLEPVLKETLTELLDQANKILQPKT